MEVVTLDVVAPAHDESNASKNALSVVLLQLLSRNEDCVVYSNDHHDCS